MNDTEILDWLEKHVTQFTELITSAEEEALYRLDYMDSEGNFRVVFNESLRECAKEAAKQLADFA